jgi:hypothetical protein
LAYVFQDIEELQACLLVKKPWNGVIARSHFMCMYVTLFSGLAAFSIYRRTGNRKFYRKGTFAVSSMKALANVAGMNVIPLHQLLMAEKSAFSGKDTRSIQKSFDEAIATLARCGLIHLEAIACERAGDCMAVAGDTYWSQIYYGRSMERYEEWGATAKATHMGAGIAEKHPQRSTERKDSVKFSLRGKRRYDPIAWSTIEKVDLASLK